MLIPKYYESENAFEQIHEQLKRYPCPFCHLIGCLILHGFLSGYSDTHGDSRTRRGHRIFCSDRDNRSGYGRTLSILLACFIKHFLFTSHTIWKILASIVSGMCKMKAMQDMYGPYVKDENDRAIQTRLVAFIDDATRVLCHGQFWHYGYPRMPFGQRITRI